MNKKIIKRDIQANIESWLFKGKIIILYGARQVGKTTLVKELLKKYADEAAYFNCEIIGVKQALEVEDPLALRNFLGKGKFFVLDEAQKVQNIGLILKLLIDTYPDLQIIATGSSSFDLANEISEPLTGRALEFTLYPFSWREIKDIFPAQSINSILEKFLVYGAYPEIIQSGQDDARQLLDNLSSKYLYKDILIFDRIKKPNLLISLLQLLALQIGQEVSMNELANKLQCSRDTVINYLDILEKSFIIFRLRAYSHNHRKEISKKQKIFFIDLGIRNSIISRYNVLSVRDDLGFLWENFCVSERLKKLQVQNIYCQKYFWRTQDKKEIDYVEEYDDRLSGYEFKWSKGRAPKPKEFLSYKNSTVELVNRDNIEENFLKY
jgi:predicted AAA+ superfamily ATPase